jgi:hypothetical protein
LQRLVLIGTHGEGLEWNPIACVLHLQAARLVLTFLKLGVAGLSYADASAATQYDAPPADQCQQQIHRIVHSATFRSALTLQQLFQFVADKAIAGAKEGLKEYTIGVEAFGRKPDFDPKTDPIVRVQIHRLRQKLKEYYDTEGSHDPIVVEIPKGHYLPSFVGATVSVGDINPGIPFQLDPAFSVATPLPGQNADREGKQTPNGRRGFSWLSSTSSAIAAAAIVVFATGFWIGNKQMRNGTGEAASSNPELAFGKSADPVKVFWARFLGNDSVPVIAYPDAVFLLDDSNDLFRFRQGASDSRGARVDSHLARQFASNPSLVAQAGQLYYDNGYTGTGELQGVAMLTGLFGQMGVRATIKPSRDITPDDLKQHNVILFGSPFQNIAVAQLLSTGDFTFENPDSRHEQWRAQILNAHPQTGENSAYRTERDPISQVLKTDYSLLSIQPGVVPGRYIAVLGGLDTKGTEGATMFATSKPGVDELSKALAALGGSGAKGETPVFQALVRVRLEKGYQVLDADLMAVHKFHSQTLGGVGGSTPKTSTP